MSKLDDMDRRYGARVDDPVYADPKDLRWLIARVRKLEKALAPLAEAGELMRGKKLTAEAYLWTRNTEQGNKPGISVQDAIAAADALKED